ncbi:myocardin-related transcription factor B [Syngnathus acus]|uniref:myocardin-related transcription factor B n=1 Tax=Syngnathus acus TaxID=161584 RepID=UPI0018862733|nr:myocardin-related transcription factor B [Syngnathus acus]
MGLQRCPPSTAPSMMACLHVEPPSICTGKFKSTLKAPAAFHEQIRSLNRSRTGNLVKDKLCRRPARSEMVHMKIRQESEADASVQAARLELKRALLADDIKQKIARRPGPMELVEKNDHDGDSPDPSERANVYTLSEDNSEALSPRTRGQTSPSADSVSPTRTEASPCNSSSDLSSTGEEPAATSQLIAAALTKESSPKPPGEKSRGKKSREAKPRIRKLKYHQYIPPDHHKHELKPSPAARVDAAYVRILQQQQHFLQLQILSQQHFGHQQVVLNSASDFQTSCSAKVPNENCKPCQLPSNVDEMKVAELKVELKLRSLPVSGTKMDLIERLKLYHERVGGVETKAPESTPPLSPKASGVGPEDNSRADGPAALPPGQSGSFEKDRRLHEKERQIEELKRRLEREQKLVEELKLQLEVEKRTQQLGESSPLSLSPPSPLKGERVQVKQEVDTETKLKHADHLGCLQQPCGHPVAFLPPLKCKLLREPPRYEDAVKHTRMLPAIQTLCAASQQMDDLFDILIESGEMSPSLKTDPPDANKRVAITPSVTLLPVNTVLSRPPPRVQVAHMPAKEVPLPLVAMEIEPGDGVDPESDLHGMDWLDLSVSAPEGVFTPDFLDTYQLL